MKPLKVIIAVAGILAAVTAAAALIVAFREQIVNFMLRMLDLGDRYVWTGINKKLRPDEYDDYADV